MLKVSFHMLMHAGNFFFAFLPPPIPPLCPTPFRQLLMKNFFLDFNATLAHDLLASERSLLFKRMKELGIKTQ
jgi:hypothetical protein